MAIAKVIFKSNPNAAGETWMDATTATATAADITASKTAMLADGVMTTGTGSGGGSWEVIALTQLVITADMGGGLYGGDLFFNSASIEIGEEYTVYFMEEVYTLTAASLNGMPYLGEVSGQYPSFTNYPFLITQPDNIGMLFTKEEGYYAITIVKG